MQELELLCPSVGSKWRHRNGHLYSIECGAVIEATLTAAVVYILVAAVPRDAPRRVSPPRWVRPLAEFLDGRFTFVPDGD
jgi:hypothetical protein